MLGFIEWAKARKKMNMKNWEGFRERMNEAREIFEKINDPLSLSINDFIKLSYLDEELDNSLNITEPIEALEEIETILRNPPEVGGLIDPERRIFGARITSFAILRDFISSMRSIDENTDLGVVKAKLTELLEESRKVEKAFESVNFAKGKKAIVDIQEIISSVKQEMEEIKWAANKNQKALDILKEYWSRLSSAIKVMNGKLSRATEDIALRREMRVGFAETIGEIHKAKEEGLEKRDVINAKYIIEIPPFPFPIKTIVKIPIRKLTKKQIEEKVKEIAYKFKYLGCKVKEEFLEAIKRIPVIGKVLLNRLKKKKV